MEIGDRPDMAEDKAEVARTWLWAFENDADAFRETLHPEIEWFPFEENHTPARGVEEALRTREQWLDTWDEMRTRVEEMVEEGDSVVVSMHVSARGRASGVEVEVRLHLQFKVRDGKVVYLFEHQDRTAALQAAALGV